MDCFRLVTMLHLEIQKGKEAMKTSIFQKYLVGIAACLKRLTISTKGCGQLKSNDIYFSCIWLISVKMSELMAQEFDYCGSVKTIYKGFCLDKLEKLMKD